MNEYSEEHRVSQLFGSPQGYVGYNEGAQLADALTEEPHTIVIFDEIEKAHPKIHQVLMNLFNTGTFSTPAKGSTGSREIHCSQAIFYCTSNILRGEIPPELDREDSWAIDMYIRKQVVAAGWKSEIVDRINRFLWFSVLKQDDLVSVTLQELQKICESYSVQLSSVEPKVIAKMLMGVKDTSSVRRIAKHIEQQLDVRLLAVADTSIPYRLIGPNPYQLVPNIQKGGVLCLED
jgi:ATP-dependent Clp protease ATP-binding subunit ClpA